MTSTEKEVAVSVRAGQQVKIPQFTEQDQRTRERKVNNLDMRAHCWLSPQAQPSNCTHLSTHVIMMRGREGKEAKKRVGAIRLFWTRHPSTDEMDSGYTRSISVSTSSQCVLDYHSIWIKTSAALGSQAHRQRNQHVHTGRSLTRRRDRECFLSFLIRLTRLDELNTTLTTSK